MGTGSIAMLFFNYCGYIYMIINTHIIIDNIYAALIFPGINKISATCQCQWISGTWSHQEMKDKDTLTIPSDIDDKQCCTHCHYVTKYVIIQYFHV